MFFSNQERLNADAKTKTLSIWSELDYKTYENPFYEDSKSRKYVREIIPNYSFHKLKVWDEYFFRWYKYNDNLMKLNGISFEKLNDRDLLNESKIKNYVFSIIKY